MHVTSTARGDDLDGDDEQPCRDDVGQTACGPDPGEPQAQTGARVPDPGATLPPEPAAAGSIAHTTPITANPQHASIAPRRRP